MSESELRKLLGVPENAQRVLILSQSSHLDINWKETFPQYYTDFVENIFTSASDMLETEPRSFYSVAEMGFLSMHLQSHDNEPWRRHAANGRMRIVGGALSSPDTLLTTSESLTRDYLLGTVFAERTLGAKPYTAWLPDSFGHSPTVPDLLSAAGYRSVGFGRIDGARHSYEIIVNGLEPIISGATTTASMLKELGSADFVWQGPGGGEVLAHYMPVREYCQGDAIDLDGYALGGSRIGTERKDPGFVRAQIARFIAELTPYQKTPYLFVPVGCDFQAPRPLLPEYAHWWNERHFDSSGVWVVAATFEDYMRLVAHHRDVLPALKRDIAPVWTGFYASRPRVKRAARVAGETLAGAEAFLSLTHSSVSLDAAWHSVAMSNHHDWITGTGNDRVTQDEQIPLLNQAIGTAEQTWTEVLSAVSARIDSTSLSSAAGIIALNAGPRLRTSVVEVDMPEEVAGPVQAIADGEAFPVQIINPKRLAVVAGNVPAYGWRSFSLVPGAAPGGATATLDGGQGVISTGPLKVSLKEEHAGWAIDSLEVKGKELLAGSSLEWVLYADTGGLYRIGSERAECRDSTFLESRVVRPQALEIIESGPARVTLRATASIDGQPLTIDLIASAGAERLMLRVTGVAATDRTIALRVRPQAPENELLMGVAGGIARRALSHHYTPSLWPAVTWVSRGALAVHLGQSTAVHGKADGTLEWVVFRNAEDEASCEALGPSGREGDSLTVEFSLGARDVEALGATEAAASLELSRPMRATVTTSHSGDLVSSGQLFTLEEKSVVVTALKPAHRGEGLVMHLERFGPPEVPIRLRHGVLPWTEVTRPDLLERDDASFGQATEDGVEGLLPSSLNALRLKP